MSDDYSTTSDTTSDTSTDTSDSVDTSSLDAVDTSDLPEDTSGSDGSEDLPETDTSDSVDTDEVTDAEEIADETDSTDDSANETSDSFSDDEVSSTDTSELSEATAGSDGSENLPDGDNERLYTEESSETDTADTPPEAVDADHSDELNDTDDVETDGAGDLDSPEKPEESDGSENLHGNDPSQEDIRDDQEVDENSDKDDGVDNLPNGCDDDLEETPDSVESDDKNDKQSDLEKGIADTVKNSGAEDSDDFSERKPIDNSEVHRNKSYANDDLGNAERKRDEAYQALLDYRNANNLGRSMEPSQEEQRLIDKANEARDKYERLKHAQDLRDAMADNSNEYRSIVESLNDSGVNHRPIEKSDYDRSTRDIIDHLGGGDLTQGSCSSLAFAYAGNKAGYNVLDFRDGESRSFFSQNSSIGSIANLPNVDSRTVYGKDDINCANELMKSMDPGKDYYLATGQHASIVRKADDGYQYLELQSAHNNGWKTLDDNALQNRFGCASDNQYEYPNYLIDVDSLGNSAEFRDILGYINTADNQQMKGVYGHVK